MKDYRLVDWATQVYVVLVGLLVLVFHGDSVPVWRWLVVGHVLVGVLLHTLIRVHARQWGGVVIRFLRDYYPILLYTAFYRETGLVNEMFVHGYVDPWVMSWDAVLFGCQPSLVWMDRWPIRWWSEVMYGCYFSYYFMIGGVSLALLIRNRDQFNHFITVVSLVFYVCYFTYVILPVMGPRIFYAAGLSVTAVGGEAVQHPRWGVLTEDPPAYPETIRKGVFYNMVAFLYRYFESEGAAFPSSHVALALVTLYFSWIYLPRVRWLHLLFAVGLLLSTVYCRFHYVVDVFAGITLAVLLVPLANRLHRRWENHPPSPPS